jgi:hypothetical protein
MAVKNRPSGAGMRKRTRTIEVTFERERHVAVRAAVPGPIALCAECTGEAIMLTPLEAARVAGVSQLEIYRLIEAHSAHYIEESNGMLLVCVKSVLE